jgi:predicted DNA-binding protein (MmcQ/YjbR family)
MGKMFTATSLNYSPFRVNLKCDPEKAIELREQYECIEPGYHMSKKHWNTVYFETGEIPENEIIGLVNHSYDLVVSGLTKRDRALLDKM